MRRNAKMRYNRRLKQSKRNVEETEDRREKVWKVNTKSYLQTKRERDVLNTYVARLSAKLHIKAGAHFLPTVFLHSCQYLLKLLNP